MRRDEGGMEEGRKGEFKRVLLCTDLFYITSECRVFNLSRKIKVYNGADSHYLTGEPAKRNARQCFSNSKQIHKNLRMCKAAGWSLMVPY